jgi:hypothetical protein
MRRLLLVGVAALSVLASACSMAASEEICAVVVKIKKGSVLSVYEKPNTKSELVGSIEPGVVVTVIRVRNVEVRNWDYIFVDVEGGDVQGWVPTKYLKPVKCPPLDDRPAQQATPYTSPPGATPLEPK